MKAFWKKYGEVRLEDFLIESFMTGRDYCITFKKVPDQRIEENFKERFAHDIFEYQEKLDSGVIQALD